MLGETQWETHLYHRLSHSLECAHPHWESPKGDVAFLTCIWSGQLFTCGCLWTPHRALEFLKQCLENADLIQLLPPRFAHEVTSNLSNVSWFPVLPIACEGPQQFCVCTLRYEWRWPDEGRLQHTLLSPSSLLLKLYRGRTGGFILSACKAGRTSYCI